MDDDVGRLLYQLWKITPLEDTQKKFSKNMRFLKFRFVQEVFLAGLSSTVPSHIYMYEIRSEFDAAFLCPYNVYASF